MVLLFPKMLHTPEKNFFQNLDVTFPVFAYLLVKRNKYVMAMSLDLNIKSENRMRERLFFVRLQLENTTINTS